VQAQWEYQQPDGSFSAYPVNINAIIEKCFQANEPFAEWEETDNIKYRIDFAKGKEYQVNASRLPECLVRRVGDGTDSVLCILSLICLSIHIKIRMRKSL